MAKWPDWWSWDIELSVHLYKRMLDRKFNESDLRLMLEDASGYHKDVEEGRWAVETLHDARAWEVIVEPMIGEKILVVVTAYPVE